MVNVVMGNLLDAKEDIIGHQVNCQGAMGGGIAKQIKEKYEAAYIGYMNYCYGKNPYDLLGNCQIVDVGKGKFVANLFGQLNYGRTKYRYTDYDALQNALHQLKAIAKRNKLTVALPYNIGCGLANGDWDVVTEILEQVFSDYDVTLYRLEQ
jgi:O-acetyl-ADP-ribose deacetylase (regulator of RNase III)